MQADATPRRSKLKWTLAFSAPGLALFVGGSLIAISMLYDFVEMRTNSWEQRWFAIGDTFVVEPDGSPQRGDTVLVGADPPDAMRVIAVEGEELRLHAGRLFINEWEVPQCYVGKLHNDHHAYVEFLGSKRYLVTYPYPHDRYPCKEPELWPRGCYRGFGGYGWGPYNVGHNEQWLLLDDRNGELPTCTSNPNGALGTSENRRGVIRKVLRSKGGPAAFPPGNSLSLSHEDRGLRPALEACLAHPPSQTLPPKR
ncbi:MAG: S26 family signal peptidase [Polyangiaceae bacterium]